MEQLATIPWNELFHRDPIYFQQSVEGVMRAVSTDATQYEITEWRTVSEILAPEPRSYEVKILQISPYQSRDGDRGVFGIVRARPLSEMSAAPKKQGLSLVGG